MSKNCPNCGNEISFDGALFCPECGHKFTGNVVNDIDFGWIENILMVHDEKTGERRVSKAKLAGIIIFLLYIFGFLMQSGYHLRLGAFDFIFSAFLCIFAGLFYYFICRGIGYIVRKIGN